MHPTKPHSLCLSLASFPPPHRGPLDHFHRRIRLATRASTWGCPAGFPPEEVVVKGFRGGGRGDGRGPFHTGGGCEVQKFTRVQKQQHLPTKAGLIWLVAVDTGTISSPALVERVRVLLRKMGSISTTTTVTDTDVQTNFISVSTRRHKESEESTKMNPLVTQQVEAAFFVVKRVTCPTNRLKPAFLDTAPTSYLGSTSKFRHVTILPLPPTPLRWEESG
ncbi:unnamed protein product [Mesocestoides corti]|uniref:Uncharacterized protein n=1 Tax=Mesocestoides corti TaxID=53468 RepID=A0A0R3U2N6_MESCO|nr:unnamed protein product [Mesocestoides corti]